MLDIIDEWWTVFKHSWGAQLLVLLCVLLSLALLMFEESILTSLEGRWIPLRVYFRIDYAVLAILGLGISGAVKLMRRNRNRWGI